MQWFKNIFRRKKKEKAPAYYKIPEHERMSIIERSCKQVSRGVFFSTIIIITSFLPVFLLTGQEGHSEYVFKKGSDPMAGHNH